MNPMSIAGGAFTTLRRHKLRTFFMAIGIITGIAVLVGTRVLGDQLEGRMTTMIERLIGTNSFVIAARGTDAGGPGAPAKTLTIAEAEALPREIDGVILADVMQTQPDTVVQYRDRSRTTTIFGNSERSEMAWARSVTAGAFYTRQDVAEAARVALLGPKIAIALFGSDSAIGKEIRIGNIPFVVKGVLEPMGVDGHGVDRDEDVQVPITTLMRRVMNVDYLSMIKLTVRDDATVEELGAQVLEVLRKRHGIGAGEPDDVRVLTPRLLQDLIAKMLMVVQVLVPAAGAVCLFVAALIVANIILASVRDRVREIGLRRAVGARPVDIAALFLAEALVISLLAGLVGIALAQGALWFYAVQTKTEVPFSWSAILIGVGATLAVSLMAGLLPALRAAKLDPVQALRDA